VKACLLAGVPIDSTSKKKGGETPLYLAAKNGHIHICQYLLERGADVNFQGDRGHKRTALHAAALTDDADLTYLLLSQPTANPQLKDLDSLTAAGTAAKNGCDNALSVFISKGLTSQIYHSSARRTCINLAIGSGNLSTLKLLMNDASLYPNNCYGEMTPSTFLLHVATREGYWSIIRPFLEKGANIELNNEDGQTLLLVAASNGHDVVVRLLLENGANIDSKDKDGQTPLLLAAKDKRDTIVKLLLEKDANLEGKDIKHGRTSLSWAARYGCVATVKLLLDKGANFESKENDSWMPLLSAAWHGNYTIVELLLEKGANIELSDKHNRTPLLLATWNGHEAVRRLLLEKGANVESNDNDNWTPLFLAAWEGHEAVDRLLLERAANGESQS
jgi:ankyrin repeat protein